MELRKLEGIVPTRITCYQLVELLETEYAISITFWLTVSNPPGGEVHWRLFANGSGDLWDHIYMAGYTASARVSDMHQGSIYPALWATLVDMATQLGRTANALAAAQSR